MMDDTRSQVVPQRLPAAARWLSAGTALAAASLLAVTLVLQGAGSVNPLVVAAMAIGIGLGEAFRIDLPYRRGGNASFGLADAALTAGLILASAPEVVLAAALATVVVQLAERVTAAKLAFNVAQYVAGAAAAALTVHLLAPRPGGLDASTFVAVALGLLLFLLVNTTTVSTMIALTSGRPWRDTFTRLARTAVLLSAGSMGLGLLAVLLAGTHPWALPTLVLPLAMLYSSSRHEVAAKVDRERSAAFVAVEQALGEATRPEQIAAILAEGAGNILGCNAAVWRDGRWATPVPPGSTDCPVDADLGLALVARGPALGPAAAGQCAAIGLGGGVLVVWPGELEVNEDTEEWLERLSRSGRVHFARVAAASALEQERATLRAVVDGTADGILVLDEKGVIRLWNNAMARLTGMSALETVGRAAADVLGPGSWSVEGVHDVDRRDDRVWRVAVSKLEDTVYAGLHVAVVHDVSAERRLARAKDDMLAVVSHELRTPLTPIKASAQLLRTRFDRLTAEHRETLLAQIEDRADHLARLVEDLLLVGQLSAAESRHPVAVKMVAMDLVELAADAVSQQQLAHPTRPLGVEAPPKLRVLSDALRVRQILDNLIDNACKFSPAGSPVDVVLDSHGDAAVLQVVDRGRGIAPDDLGRVFEPFERTEDPMVMTTSGAGLGLSIVKALCDALDGSVSIASTLGEGTTVTVRLPLLAGAARAASRSQERGSHPDGQPAASTR